MSHSLYLDVKSIPDDGSSKRMSFDPAMSEIATDSLLFVPPDKFCEYTSCYSLSYSLSSHFSTSSNLFIVNLSFLSKRKFLEGSL